MSTHTYQLDHMVRLEVTPMGTARMWGNIQKGPDGRAPELRRYGFVLSVMESAVYHGEEVLFDAETTVDQVAMAIFADLLDRQGETHFQKKWARVASHYTGVKYRPYGKAVDDPADIVAGEESNGTAIVAVTDLLKYKVENDS